jgi:hypothetical protein
MSVGAPQDKSFPSAVIHMQKSSSSYMHLLVFSPTDMNVVFLRCVMLITFCVLLSACPSIKAVFTVTAQAQLLTPDHPAAIMITTCARLSFGVILELPNMSSAMCYFIPS